MTAFRLKIIEVILVCIFMAVGLLWSYFAMADHFAWLLEYVGAPAFAFLFFAVSEYFRERNIRHPDSHFWQSEPQRPRWLSFFIVVVSGVLMLNLFAWVGMGGWSSGIFFWMAILTGGSLGKLAAMYRFGTAPATDAE